MTAPAVLLRADGSDEIGLGHVMRCGALAAALRAAGARVLFAFRLSPGRTFVPPGLDGEQIDLPEDATEEEDARRTLAALPAGPAAVVVDHYRLGPVWWRLARARASLAAIDDLGRPELAGEVDLVLNQNPGADPAWYSGVPRVLAGPRHALLRPVFASLREQTPPVDPASPVRRILVTAGGSDPRGATAHVLEAIRSVAGEFRVEAIRGPAFRDDGRLAAAAGRDPRTEVIAAPPDLPERMAAADLVVSGAGSTVLELASIGRPALVIRTADNQRGIAAAAAAAGAAVDLGDVERLRPATAAAEIAALIADGPRRAAMSAAGRTLVDACGAVRSARAILALPEADGAHATPGEGRRQC